MLEDSLWTLSEIEEMPALVLVRGLINQSQAEPSSDDQGEENQDEVPSVCERKLTSKGRAYQMGILHKKRVTEYAALSKEIKQAYLILEQGSDLRELKRQRDILDTQKEHFNDAHRAYHELLQSFDENEASYHWFDICDQEYQQCRLRFC